MKVKKLSLKLILSLTFLFVEFVFGAQWTGKGDWEWLNRLRANNVFEKPVTKSFIVRLDLIYRKF